MSANKLEPADLDDVIFDCTHHYEKLQHGKPSGCDATCVLKGGLLSYQLRQPPEITQVKTLPNYVDKLSMFVVYTGKQRDTAKLVEAVSQLKQNEPENFKELVGTIADVSAEMTELL